MSAMTEVERVVLWAQSVVDGEPLKRPSDLRIARTIVGLDGQLRVHRPSEETTLREAE
jgi:hypothetical protein